METATERSWIELNIENLKHNVRILREAIPPACELMAVVKADAYGHGACATATVLNQMEITAFAVATVEEGIQLRKHGIRGEILILGYTDVKRVQDLQKYDLTQTLLDFAYAQALNSRNAAVKTHIKIDTGMHRLGISGEEISAVRKVFEMKNLKICGIYTHLCCADSRLPEDIAFTRRQIDSFYRLTDALKNNGIQLPKLHIQSSCGFLNYPDLVCDYVRVGIALYGVSSVPDNEAVLQPALRPVLALKSRVVLIRFIGKGDSVGYGRTFVAGRDSRIAVIPVGYGDGFPGSLSGKNVSVLVNRQSVPVVGRICMDQLTVDITDAENVKVGDIVTLIGTEAEQNVAAPVVAQSAGSISNELLCRLGTRLPIVMK